MKFLGSYEETRGSFSEGTQKPFHGRFVKIEFHSDFRFVFSSVFLSVLRRRVSLFHFVCRLTRASMKTAMERGDTIGCGITGLTWFQAEKKQETLLRRKKRQNGERGIYKEKADARAKKKKKKKKRKRRCDIFNKRRWNWEKRDSIRGTFNKDHEKVQLRCFLFELVALADDSYDSLLFNNEILETLCGERCSEGTLECEEIMRSKRGRQWMRTHEMVRNRCTRGKSRYRNRERA